MKKGLKTLALSALILGASNLPIVSSQKLYSPPLPEYRSFSESLMLNEILDSARKKKIIKDINEYSWRGGISVNTMIRQFLPYLNQPNYSIDPGFELKIAPNLSLEATCEPFTSIQLEGQQPKIGIYFKFKF